MAKAISQKCRQCSKLSAKEAQEKECWNPKLCHQRRYNYRHRGSRVKEQREKRKAERALESPAIYTLAPIAIFYRKTKESPVHAIAAELKENGKTIATVEPVHCFGATEGEIIRWLRKALETFSRDYGRNVGRYVQETSEYSPSECPICRAIESDGD